MTVGLMSRVDSATDLGCRTPRSAAAASFSAHIHHGTMLAPHAHSTSTSRSQSRDSSPCRAAQREARTSMPSGVYSRLGSNPSLFEACPGSPCAPAARPPLPRSQVVSPSLQAVAVAIPVSNSVPEAQRYYQPQAWGPDEDEPEELADAPATLGSKDDDPLLDLLPRNVARSSRSALAVAALRSAVPPHVLAELINTSLNPSASLEDRLPMAPTNPFGLGAASGLGQRISSSGRASSDADKGLNWLASRMHQLKKHRWIITGASLIWVVLNLHQWADADLTSSSDATRTALDVLMNGPQMAQVVKELSQVGFALLLTFAQGRIPNGPDD